MELKQKLELRRLLVPELKQSLKILSLPLLDLKNFIEEELLNNPCLEETEPKSKPEEHITPLPFQERRLKPDLEFRLNSIIKETTLQDVLLRQLGMFTNTDEEYRVGQEIIGNIDENGYLKTGIEEIANALNVSPDKVEDVLKIIQEFEPAGVGARTIAECLLIQLKLANEKDPLLIKIVDSYLEDVAKKNYSHIAKSLKEPLEKIEPLIKKIIKLDPKPGRNYSINEAQQIIPDVIIDNKDEELQISISDEDLPTLNINKDYKEMLKDGHIDPQTKEFLAAKLRNALELLRALSRRKSTLRKIVEIIVEIQQDAIRNDLSCLKPLTFKDVAERINMHESTVCRAIMNKYVRLPCGVVALKNFFPSHIQDQNGQAVSSNFAKRLIKELIEREDKKHPLSDQDIAQILLKEHNLNVSRRTVAKYREALKLLSTTFRRER
jgi:RNA polymerase sigma-54 factor